MINTDGTLAEFLPELQSAEWVALDTEADSLHAYPEKLCLIQISTTRHDKLVDPLAAIDLTPLWPILKKHELIIMHGADYDLRLLRKTNGFVPNKIFDTMLASRLLGEREFGLVSLVKKHLGITLEKGSQKADWSKRPLTPRMEAYARADTHHLKPLSDILKEQLRQKDRLSWLEQCCDRLIAECAIPTKPEPDLVWRVKGSHHLTPRALAVLREIWRWREKEALASNRPPFFVLSHEGVDRDFPLQQRITPPTNLCFRRIFLRDERTACWKQFSRAWLSRGLRSNRNWSDPIPGGKPKRNANGS